MSIRPTFTSLDRWGDHPVLALADDEREHEAFIPASRLVSWEVDWNRQGGAIDLLTLQGVGMCAYRVVFPDGDHGQACSDAIETIVKALAA